MSKLAIYTMIICQTIVMANATETTAQHKFLREISVELESKVGERKLLDLVTEIESKSDFHFAYSKAAMRKLSVELDGGQWNMDELMKEISEQLHLSIRRVNQTISMMPVAVEDPLPTINEDFSNQQTISGRITDEVGEPLPGASIIEKGTTNGTTTDINGNYKLSVPQGAKLTISFVGYQTREITVGSESQINIEMQLDSEQLEEIVVIGYGTVKKSDLTGSVASVDSEEINSTPTLRLDDALRGKVAGLQVTPTSSAPGASSTIRIRGSNSISANNEPLYVIDGFIGVGSLNDINMNDIESVEILKDASATAIYGSRGSNGVIIITTKKGKAGSTRFSYETYYNFQSPTRLFDMLNASEFGEWINEVKGTSIYPDPASLGEGTDWQKEIYQNNALMVNHNLSLSGGNDKSKYYISGNFLDQDGIHIESNFKRWQFRVNTEHKLSNRFTMGNNLTLSRTINKQRTSTSENTAGWDPTIPVFDSNGKYTYQTVSSEMAADNPVSIAKQVADQELGTRILGNIFGEFEILDGLKYRLNAGINLNNRRREQYAPSSLFAQTANQGTATIQNWEDIDLLLENTINYSKTFGDHSINGLVGYTRQTITNTNNLVQTIGFVTDAYLYNNLGAGTIRSNAGSNLQEQGLESYLVRVNYSFKDKYLFTASARRDGSSVFAKNNKWGTFPSVAFAWRAIDEPFIQSLGLFDDLKVRASYGQLGNPGVSPGASLSRLAQGGNNYILGVNQNIVSGIAANSLGNDNLKWETTKQFNYGIDFALFNNRLQSSIDYYSKTTTDLLVDVPLLWLTGFATSLSNFGEVSNKGVELSLTSVNMHRGDFKWESNFNISANRNKVVDLDSEDGFLYINEIGRGAQVISGILKEGEPLGTFYGLVADGIWNSQEEIDQAGVTGFSVFPGGRRYEDLDGDGVIDATLDRQIIGNANPDFYGGFGNTLSYKGFELYFYFAFVVGNEIFNEAQSRLAVAFDNNTFAEFADRWTPTNTDTDVPSAAAVERPLVTSNSSAIEDGSFLRLRNINISYNLPVDGVSWLNAAKVYVTGTNLLLFDQYSGYDPEVSRGFSNVRRGYDLAQDPTTKSFTVGLKLDF